MKATGYGGALRYGYQQAAKLGPWVIESVPDSTGFRFKAPLVEADEYWIACRPLHLVLALGQVEWIWQDVQPQVELATVTILLTRRPDVAGARIMESDKEHRAS